jgi:zeaxanthin glucosyltransferase
VTEACAAGVPMVVLPMSTDQFAGAAAIERAGIGVALDPNALDAEMLRSAVDDLLASGATERVQAIARSISEHGGPAVAVEAIRAAS